MCIWGLTWLLSRSSCFHIGDFLSLMLLVALVILSRLLFQGLDRFFPLNSYKCFASLARSTSLLWMLFLTKRSLLCRCWIYTHTECKSRIYLFTRLWNLWWHPWNKTLTERFPRGSFAKRQSGGIIVDMSSQGGLQLHRHIW